MYLIAMAWGFVVVLMALVEATSTQGTVLGAFFTLLLYGVLPLSIVLYVLGAPSRSKARKKLESVQASVQPSAQEANDGDHATALPAKPLPPVGKES